MCKRDFTSYNSEGRIYCSDKCYNKTKFGRVMSETAKDRIRQAKIGDKNPMWKGDAVGYTALHDWVKRHLPQPELCQRCKERPAIDAANISGEYKRDLTDWEYLCRTCHMNEDGRMEQLNILSRSRSTKL